MCGFKWLVSDWLKPLNTIGRSFVNNCLIFVKCLFGVNSIQISMIKVIYVSFNTYPGSYRRKLGVFWCLSSVNRIYEHSNVRKYILLDGGSPQSRMVNWMKWPAWGHVEVIYRIVTTDTSTENNNSITTFKAWQW